MEQPKPAQDPGGGELALIERIRRRAAGAFAAGESGLQLGIGDDCAIIRPRHGEELVVTTDFSLEGRHFRHDWHTPESIGHRALARGLSDLAAMGARPMAAFLSLALPQAVARDTPWLDRFLDGLMALSARAGVPLAGGDTSEAPSDEVLIDIVLLGSVPQGRALRRDGARPGDRLFVTGSLGGSAAELESLAQGTHDCTGRPFSAHAETSPHLFPEPRLAAGQALLAERLATAAMDLSDGLSSDLARLCVASGVAAEVDAAKLPLHKLLVGRTHEAALAAALHGGEDYELLFTAPPDRTIPASIGRVELTEIGRILPRTPEQASVMLVDADGRRSALEAGGWEHLR